MTAQMRIGFALLGIAALIAGALVLDLVFVDETDKRVSPDATTVVGATPATAAEGHRTVDRGPLLRPGATRRISVEKGDIVRFRARSKTADELHIHGYDLYVRLPAGKTVSYRFKATLDGIFEIELHGSGERVAELRVSP